MSMNAVFARPLLGGGLFARNRFVRLSARMGLTEAEGNQYIALIIGPEGVLTKLCAKEGVPAATCSQYQAQFTTYEGQFETAVANGDLISIGTSSYLLYTLYQNIKDALAYEPPPPQVCPPGYTGTYPNCVPPVVASKSLSWLEIGLIALGAVAVVGGTVYVVTR